MPPASPRASVLSTAAERPEATSWSASIGAGFWRPWPHHVLERRLHYPEEAVSAREHAVVDERSAATIYRIWEQHFSRDKLEALLADADFEIEHFAACSPSLRAAARPANASGARTGAVDQPLRVPDRVLVHRVGGPARILADARVSDCWARVGSCALRVRPLVPPTICSRRWRLALADAVFRCISGT